MPRSSRDAPRRIKNHGADYSFLSDKNRTLFSLSFCLDTKERKNQGTEFLFFRPGGRTFLF